VRFVVVDQNCDEHSGDRSKNGEPYLGPHGGCTSDSLSVLRQRETVKGVA
jgi:hypothetical protein